jgi:polyhydroxyalkanoate synthesis regulator protein
MRMRTIVVFCIIIPALIACVSKDTKKGENQGGKQIQTQSTQKATGAKLVAMQKVVDRWIEYSVEAFSNKEAYLKVKKAQEDFSSIPFNAKENKEEAKAILRLMTDSKEFRQTHEMIRVAEQTDSAYDARELMRNLTKETSQIQKDLGADQ